MNPTTTLSLRERKKLDAMRRIKQAARDLMWEKGYDETTTKEIAELAEIGEATLFRYVTSKLDLFIAIYSEEFEKVIERCEAVESDLPHQEPTGDPQSYIDRIVDMYCRLASLYVRYPALAYTYVKESFGSETDAGLAGLAQSDRWYKLLESVLGQAHESGAFRCDDVEQVAQNCHALYVHEVLRTHARRLSAAEIPDRLRLRLTSLLEPLGRSR